MFIPNLPSKCFLKVHKHEIIYISDIILVFFFKDKGTRPSSAMPLVVSTSPVFLVIFKTKVLLIMLSLLF
jgi:hypothetical protein